MISTNRIINCEVVVTFYQPCCPSDNEVDEKKMRDHENEYFFSFFVYHCDHLHFHLSKVIKKYEHMETLSYATKPKLTRRSKRVLLSINLVTALFTTYWLSTFLINNTWCLKRTHFLIQARVMEEYLLMKKPPDTSFELPFKSLWPTIERLPESLTIARLSALKWDRIVQLSRWITVDNDASS